MTDGASESSSSGTEASPITDEGSYLPPGKRQWWLAGLAWLLSLGAFFVPQRIPLEWYPLNEPGNDIHYLEIKCAADADGWVTIWYDITHGWSDIDQIKFPISPTEQTYTYTFPLPDAPLTRLRMDTVAQGGSLKVHHMRIINRRGEEVRNFPLESIEPITGIARVSPYPPGWTLHSIKNAVAAGVAFAPFPTIEPVGMTGRNIHRCLLSTGYLAGMLVILMLAVTSAFWRPTGWRDFVGHIVLLALIAIPFSAVGNRGLIRNTIRYATFDPTERPLEPTLEITVRADRTAETQLYWDTGNGFSEAASLRRSYLSVGEPQTLRFPLPKAPLKTLRFDPDDRAIAMTISAVAVSDGRTSQREAVPHLSSVPVNQIAELRAADGALVIESIPDTEDPYMHFGDDAISAINDAAGALRSASP